jgi:hypothetical protein
MIDLETLIAELEDNDTSDGHDTTYIGARAVMAIGRELLTARKVVKAAQKWAAGFECPGQLDDALLKALTAYDAAKVAHNEEECETCNSVGCAD